MQPSSDITQLLIAYSEGDREALDRLMPLVYEHLKRALELGRWPDGRILTPQQKQETMQAVIAWGQLHLPEDERVGYIDAGSKQGDTCDDPQPLKWRD